MFELSSIGKFIIIMGILLVAIGIFISFMNKLPFLGRLPGDILVKRGNFTFFFPVVTCLVVSVLITLLLNLFLRR